MMEHLPIDNQLFILKDIENHLDTAVVFLFVSLHGINGDLCRLSLRKAEYTCGDTAERNAFTAVFLSELQAG